MDGPQTQFKAIKVKLNDYEVMTTLGTGLYPYYNLYNNFEI
jgi:hypothetical protein